MPGIAFPGYCPVLGVQDSGVAWATDSSKVLFLASQQAAGLSRSMAANFKLRL
jgi:hypothetical protein